MATKIGSKKIDSLSHWLPLNLKPNFTIGITISNIVQVDKMVKIKEKYARGIVKKKYYSVYI